MSDLTYFRVGVPRDMVADIMWNDDFEVSMEPITLKRQPMESELKLCPFCGGEAELEHVYVRYANAPALDQWIIRHRCNIVKDVFFPSGIGKEQAIEAWNTRQGKTCDGCKHFGKIVDYHVDPCCECVRNAPDLYEPKEDADADGA